MTVLNDCPYSIRSVSFATSVKRPLSVKLRADRFRAMVASRATASATPFILYDFLFVPRLPPGACRRDFRQRTGSGSPAARCRQRLPTTKLGVSRERGIDANQFPHRSTPRIQAPHRFHTDPTRAPRRHSTPAEGTARRFITPQNAVAGQRRNRTKENRVADTYNAVSVRSEADI